MEKVEELKNAATDGKEVYYAGEKLVNADINTIKTIEDALFIFMIKKMFIINLNFYHLKITEN